MRIAIISDIHGNQAGLNIVWQDSSIRQVDQVISLGDIVDGAG